MAKRFIDTNIFKKSFTRSLNPDMKLFWIYLLNDCDHAGIWIKDIEIASLYTGNKLKEKDIKDVFNNKIIELDRGEKWMIPSFIEFQYGNLYKNNKAHYAVIKIIEKYELQHLFSIDDSKPEDIISFRKRLTTSAKNQVLARDNHRCQYCGSTDIDLLNIDHIVALNDGGNNQDYNLITSCVTCNSKKSDKDVFVFIEENKINLLEGASKKIEAAYRNLKGSMDMDKDKVKEMDKVMVKDKEQKKENLILPFNSAEFLLAWENLLKTKKWRNKSEIALQASLKKLVSVSEQDAIRMIENSIAGEWQGLFELKNNNNGTRKQSNYNNTKSDVNELVAQARAHLRSYNGNDNAGGD